MDNSLNKSSPGFVYFVNPSNSPKAETSDYMGFSDKPSSPGQFTPRNYSSPQQNQKGNSQQKQWGNSPQKWGNSLQKQWGTPPTNYNGRNQGRFKKRFSTPNQSFSPNKTYNSSFNNSNPSMSFGQGNSREGSRMEKSFNKHLYLHPSFMEDPWRDLEKKLLERISLRDSMNDNISELDITKKTND